MKEIFALVLVGLMAISCQQKQDDFASMEYKLFFADNQAGYYSSSQDADGNYRFVMEYNDRGRGPHLEESIKLNENRVIESLEILGHNYLKDTVSEVFTQKDGSASWKSTSESGEKSLAEEAFFVGVNSSYGNAELLIRKLLGSADKAIDLLPSGTVRISNEEKIQISDSLSLNLIEVTGFSFTPNYYWLDSDNRFFAAPSTWLSCIRSGYESVSEQLLTIQTDREKAYYGKLASNLTQKTDGKIAIKNVSVFDANRGLMVSNKTVIVNGNRIEAILSAGASVPEVAREIDGTDRTFLPGLFDMHTHLGRSDGILNLAAGVTSVRDLANSLDLPEIRDEFNENKVLGPRILIMSGFIDKAGPYAGPIGKIVSSLEEALAAVDYYYERGYQQIKLYSSIEPEWVKPIATKAHSLGMKVSGHIPAHMLAQDAVKNGYDEIQHVNMLALNFMSDTIDSRTPLRFSMIGRHAHEINVQSPEFKSFAKLLKTEKIVLDPTVSIFEGMLTTKAGEPDPQMEAVLDRLPIQVKRGFYSGGLPIPDGMEDRYKESYQRLLEIVFALYSEGVTIVPGTDAMPGFALHKELENYAKAGIPNAEVLRMATIISAKVIGVEDELGSVDIGKLADLILVDGNPLEDMSAIRRVELTIKDGNIYEAEKLYESIGVKHFK
ncbi:MAG: amidohydrolase family protein [Cyclobacteriaceae bacterium]